MAIRRTRKNAQSTSKRKSTNKKGASASSPLPPEPIAARVMQSAILVVAALLLFSALSTPRAGMLLVGLLILVTAFPPIRGPVDVWMTGKRRGKHAQQAAAVRMILGAATILSTLMGVFTSG